MKCEKCANIFQLKSLLDVHKLTHSKYECKGKNCRISFENKKQFDVHKKNCHEIENEAQLKQFNCDDCPFQGENRIELKKHIQRTEHCPSECIEKCYT